MRAMEEEYKPYLNKFGWHKDGTPKPNLKRLPYKQRVPEASDEGPAAKWEAKKKEEEGEEDTEEEDEEDTEEKEDNEEYDADIWVHHFADLQKRKQGLETFAFYIEFRVDFRAGLRKPRFL